MVASSLGRDYCTTAKTVDVETEDWREKRTAEVRTSIPNTHIQTIPHTVRNYRYCKGKSSNNSLKTSAKCQLNARGLAFSFTKQMFIQHLSTPTVCHALFLVGMNQQWMRQKMLQGAASFLVGEDTKNQQQNRSPSNNLQSQDAHRPGSVC